VGLRAKNTIDDAAVAAAEEPPQFVAFMHGCEVHNLPRRQDALQNVFTHHCSLIINKK
jgi:hypothetical protein